MTELLRDIRSLEGVTNGYWSQRLELLLGQGMEWDWW